MKLQPGKDLYTLVTEALEEEIRLTFFEKYKNVLMATKLR